VNNDVVVMTSISNQPSPYEVKQLRASKLVQHVAVNL